MKTEPSRAVHLEDVTFVISNYNFIPLELMNLSRNWVLYDQSDDPKIRDELQNVVSKLQDGNPISRRYVRAKHVGHNLLDYIQWIETEHAVMTRRVALLKGNSVPRHTTSFDEILAKLAGDNCSPIYSRSLYPSAAASRVQHGSLFTEKNNSWYAATKRAQFFSSFNQFCTTLFENYKPRKYIHFSPAASFVFNSSSLKSIDRYLVRALRLILESAFFPTEAYYVERLFPMALEGDLILRDIWRQPEEEIARFLQQIQINEFPPAGGPLRPIRHLSSPFNRKIEIP